MSARHKKVRKNSIAVANRYVVASLSLAAVFGVGAAGVASAAEAPAAAAGQANGNVDESKYVDAKDLKKETLSLLGGQNGIPAPVKEWDPTHPVSVQYTHPYNLPANIDSEALKAELLKRLPAGSTLEMYPAKQDPKPGESQGNAKSDAERNAANIAGGPLTWFVPSLRNHYEPAPCGNGCQVAGVFDIERSFTPTYLRPNLPAGATAADNKLTFDDSKKNSNSQEHEESTTVEVGASGEGSSSGANPLKGSLNAKKSTTVRDKTAGSEENNNGVKQEVTIKNPESAYAHRQVQMSPNYHYAGYMAIPANKVILNGGQYLDGQNGNSENHYYLVPVEWDQFKRDSSFDSKIVLNARFRTESEAQAAAKESPTSGSADAKDTQQKAELGADQRVKKSSGFGDGRDPSRDPNRDRISDPNRDPSRDRISDPSRDPNRDRISDPSRDRISDPNRDPSRDRISDPNRDPSRDRISDPNRDRYEEHSSDRHDEHSSDRHEVRGW